MNLTPNQLHILQHSLGVDQYGRGKQYRNHYAVTPETPTHAELKALEAAGLMKDHGKVSMWGELHGFTVTEEGKRVMAEQSPKPPKVSRARQRYREWLRVADAFGDMTFGEYLKRKLYKRESHS